MYTFYKNQHNFDDEAQCSYFFKVFSLKMFLFFEGFQPQNVFILFLVSMKHIYL